VHVQATVMSSCHASLCHRRRAMLQVILEHKPEISVRGQRNSGATQRNRAADREAADIARAMQLSE
jgi:hypothetical protein